MELEEYRQPWENGRCWEIKKDFLQFYKDFFPEDKLQCYAQIYSNIELYQCRYPTEVMLQIQKLARHLKAFKKVPDSFRIPYANQSGKRKSEEPMSKKLKKQCHSDEKKKPNSEKKKKPDREKEEKPDSEEKEKPYCEENEKYKCLPNGLESVDYKSLIQSENFNIVEKLIAEVQKLLKLQNENAFDLILSAALHLNIEDLIDFKYTKYPAEETDPELVKYYCEFFIGTTKIGIGGGENRYLAKKNSSENALNTLTYLPLIEKLGVEVQKVLDSGQGDNAYDLMLRAALVLGMEHLLHLKFAIHTIKGTKADYTYSRKYCEVFIGATKLANGIGNNKYGAKRKASNNALYIITHLKDLPSGNIEQVRVQWNKRITSKKSSPHCKWDRELLEKMAFEMKREALKMQSVLSSVYSSFARIGRLDDLVYKAYVNNSVPRGNQEVFICDALINNVPMSSGKGISKKKAKVAAAENLMNLFLDLFESKRKSPDASKDVYADVLRLIDEHSDTPPLKNLEHITINEKTRMVEIIKSNIVPSASFTPLPVQDVKPVEISTVPTSGNSTDSLLINKRLYENSIKLGLLLFDRSEIPGDFQQTDCSNLSYSVHRCRRVITCNYLAQEDGTHKVDILLDHKVIGTGIASTKGSAKNEAGRLIMEKLRKEIYTVKIKVMDDEMIEIDPPDLVHLKIDTSKDTSDTKNGRSSSSSRSTKKKEETYKFICPENENFARIFQYYAGFSDSVDLSHFKNKLATLLRGFSKSNSFDTLKFSGKFIPSERKFLYLLGRKFGLVQNKYKKKGDKNIYLKRKISVKEFLDKLIKSGGKTSRYELVDLSYR